MQINFIHYLYMLLTKTIFLTITAGSLGLVGIKYYKHWKAEKEYEELYKMFEDFDEYNIYDEYETIKNDEYSPFRVINFKTLDEIIIQNP